MNKLLTILLVLLTTSIFSQNLKIDGVTVGHKSGKQNWFSGEGSGNKMPYNSLLSNNTAIGFNSLRYLDNGNRNTAVGSYAGGELKTADGTVWIGYNAGNHIKYKAMSNVGGIDNSNTECPLMFFDFANDTVKICGYLDVNGGSNIGGTGGITNHSDLLGLENDDHLQYALLDGRIGDNLHISTTSSLGNSAYINLYDYDTVGAGEIKIITNNGTEFTIPATIKLNPEEGIYINAIRTRIAGSYGSTMSFLESFGIDGNISQGHFYPINNLEYDLGLLNNKWNKLFTSKLKVDDGIFMTTPVKEWDSILVTKNDTVGKRYIDFDNFVTNTGLDSLELDDLIDVDLDNPDSGDILRFDDEVMNWINAPMPNFASIEDTSLHEQISNVIRTKDTTLLNVIGELEPSLVSSLNLAYLAVRNNYTGFDSPEFNTYLDGINYISSFKNNTYARVSTSAIISDHDQLFNIQFKDFGYNALAGGGTLIVNITVADYNISHGTPGSPYGDITMEYSVHWDGDVFSVIDSSSVSNLGTLKDYLFIASPRKYGDVNLDTIHIPVYTKFGYETGLGINLEFNGGEYNNQTWRGFSTDVSCTNEVSYTFPDKINLLDLWSKTGNVVHLTDTTGIVGIKTRQAKADLHVDGSIFTKGGTGDFDNDGEVFSQDFDMMLNYYNDPDSINTVERFARLDLDGNGELNLTDIYIFQSLYPDFDLTDNLQDSIRLRARVIAGSNYGILDDTTFAIKNDLLFYNLHTADEDTITKILGIADNNRIRIIPKPTGGTGDGVWSLDNDSIRTIYQVVIDSGLFVKDSNKIISTNLNYDNQTVGFKVERNTDTTSWISSSSDSEYLYNTIGSGNYITDLQKSSISTSYHWPSGATSINLNSHSNLLGTSANLGINSSGFNFDTYYGLEENGDIYMNNTAIGLSMAATGGRLSSSTTYADSIVFDSDEYRFKSIDSMSSSYVITYDTITGQLGYNTIQSGNDLWYLTDDTAKTIYNVKIDSSFFVNYDTRFIGTDNPNGLFVDPTDKVVYQGSYLDDTHKAYSTNYYLGTNGSYNSVMEVVEGTGTGGLTIRAETGDALAELYVYKNTTDTMSRIQLFHDAINIITDSIKITLDSIPSAYAVYYNKTTGLLSYDSVSSGTVDSEIDPVWIADSSDYATKTYVHSDINDSLIANNHGFLTITTLPSSILEWSDTTTIAGIGIATYDDLRNFVPAGDNLGNHSATQDLDLNSNDVVEVDSMGIGVTAPEGKLHISTDGTNALYVDLYNASTTGPTLKARKARGSLSAPRRVQSADVLGGINAFGSYAADDVTASIFPSTGSGRFQFIAAENFTSTARGTYFALALTPTSSTTASEVFRITPLGSVGIATTAPDKQLEVNNVDGNCLRLTYRDTDGTASNKTDFDVSSTGDLTITPSGGDIDFADANIHSIDTAIVEEYLSAQEISYTSSLELMRSLRINPIYYNDFQYTNIANYYPWYGIAVSSGTISAISALIDHPNIVRLGSYSSGSNTGYQIRTNTTGIILTGGEVFEMIFKVATTSNSLVRFGFHNTQTSTAPTNGIYFEISGTTASGICSDNSSNTSTRTTYTITQGTWYRGQLIVGQDKSTVTFTIYNDSGTSLWTSTITTNIPGSTRTMHSGVIATNSGNNISILDLDYMAMSLGILTR